MSKSRVESFSDCVIAFAITLLILDIHLEDTLATFRRKIRRLSLAE